MEIDFKGTLSRDCGPRFPDSGPLSFLTEVFSKIISISLGYSHVQKSPPRSQVCVNFCYCFFHVSNLCGPKMHGVKHIINGTASTNIH